ncbi:Sec-independent protein translocase protein TatB [Roseibium sp. RKSG952]|uniref:Sec-independent protein translocase protein TatB n=1 Tax=Roseibium sp. RKSG952 TaxID=2529384 RepID=UPI0012BCC867|nr:Sec-independent protein translocase protein TatB [Roseibium sp. RKSG952]MTH97252.1 twin-arginine translocase subunit TatB [Roseibium sp. RKSG952]
MFDIGWTELLVVACIAIIVVGPKDLPKMLRSLGQTIGQMRRMSREFQSTLNEALREAEKQADIADMKKQVEEAGNFNPLGDLKKSIEEDYRPKRQSNGAATAEMTGQKETASGNGSVPATEPSDKTGPNEPVQSADNAPKPVQEENKA